MEKVNISEKIKKIENFWNSKIFAELNGQHIQLMKIKGNFPYLTQENADKLFFVVKGILKLDFQ